ncbi:hypothetical protein RQN30_07015 [Arcanobacterium hippocoleae]
MLVFAGVLIAAGFVRPCEIVYTVLYIVLYLTPFGNMLNFHVFGVYLVCVIWWMRGWFLPAASALLMCEIVHLVTSDDFARQALGSLIVLVIVASIGAALRVLETRLRTAAADLNRAEESSARIRSELAVQLHDTIAKDLSQVAITAQKSLWGILNCKMS